MGNRISLFLFTPVSLWASNDSKRLSYIVYTQEPPHGYQMSLGSQSWSFSHGFIGKILPTYDFDSKLFEEPPRVLAFPTLGLQPPTVRLGQVGITSRLNASLFPRLLNKIGALEAAEPSYLRMAFSSSVHSRVTPFFAPYAFIGGQYYKLKVRGIRLFNKNNGVYTQTGEQLTVGVGVKIPAWGLSVSSSITQRREVDVSIESSGADFMKLIKEEIASQPYTSNTRVTFEPEGTSWSFQYNHVYIPSAIYYPSFSAIYKVSIL